MTQAPDAFTSRSSVLPLAAILRLVGLVFAGLGGFMLARRVAGGYRLGDSWEALWIAVAIIAWAAGLRALARVAGQHPIEPARPDPGLSAGVVGLAAALTPLSGVAVPLWLLVLAEEAYAWRPWAAAPRNRLASRAAGTVAPPSAPALQASEPPVEAEPAAEGESTSDDPRLRQQVWRVRLEQGQEQVGGWQRASIPAGGQSAAIHVAFCPPLAGAPRIDFEQVDGPPAQVKLAAAQTFGARFDVRLRSPAAEACDVTVEFRATAPAAD
jgi:hypothetical protein